MHTEDEAKGKWCPNARYGKWAANRDEGKAPEDVGYPNRCIGSACMAWRWCSPPMITRRVYSGTPEESAYTEARFRGNADTFFEFDGAMWRYEFTSSDSRGRFDQLIRSPDDDTPTHGYCGAFGKPGDA